MTPSLRDKHQSYGKVRGQICSLIAIQPDISNPLSTAFSPPKGEKAKDLFKYMIVVQKKKYGTTILDYLPSQRVHLTHLKQLLKTHDALTIKRAIKYASLRCAKPYSIRWIRVYANNMKELMNV